jgi:hypothetical protein
MRTKWLAISAIFGAFILGVAMRRASTTPFTRQPTIVATVNLRGITQSIPTTTIFTPADTGVFRVSFYAGMTTPANPVNSWNLNLNWTDDAGPETTQLGYLNSSNIPPTDYEQNPLQQEGLVSPWVFEAVAGQPITFSLLASGADPGTCGLAMTIERLQ